MELADYLPEMGATKVCFALIVFAMSVRRTEPSREAMHAINSGFVKVLDECKHELKLSDNVFAELFHFWKMEYNLVNRDTGCIIICMSKKMNLIDADGNLHHGNAQMFAMQHGAGQEIASKLMTALKDCEKQSEDVADECLRALEMGKCFRTRITGLDWTPKVEYIVEEVLTEV